MGRKMNIGKYFLDIVFFISFTTNSGRLANLMRETRFSFKLKFLVEKLKKLRQQSIS